MKTAMFSLQESSRVPLWPNISQVWCFGDLSMESKLSNELKLLQIRSSYPILTTIAYAPYIKRKSKEVTECSLSYRPSYRKLAQ